MPRREWARRSRGLRPIGQNDPVEVLFWSLWKERWTNAGPLGRTAPHRFRRYLLGIPLAGGSQKNAESSLCGILNFDKFREDQVSRQKEPVRPATSSYGNRDTHRRAVASRLLRAHCRAAPASVILSEATD